jgi:hypothetical protein
MIQVYRKPPSDLDEYKGPVPRVFCQQCARRSGAAGLCWAPTDARPGFDYTGEGRSGAVTRMVTLNASGLCGYFSPDITTRLLRRIGLRRPVIR